MKRTIFYSFLILFTFTIVCKASETLTADELIQGTNQALRTIQSGEIRIVVTDEISETWGSISTRVAHMNTAFERLDPWADDDNKLFRYKLTFVESPNYTLDSLDEYHTHPGDLHVMIFDYDNEIQVKHTLGDIVFPDGQTSFFPLDNLHYGYMHDTLAGRAPVKVPANAKQIGKEKLDGAECYILSYENSRGQVRHIWVDPAIDFCVRKMEIPTTSEKKQISERTVYKQFYKFGDIWYPNIIKSTFYEADGKIGQRSLIEVTSAVFNVDFPEDFFKIDKDYFGWSDNETRLGLLPDSDTSPIELDPGFLLCGPKSLSRICELLKVETNLIELQKLSGYIPYRGTTMLGLKTAADYKGLAPMGIKASVEPLKRKKVPLPAIAYVNNNHFLVFEDVDKQGVRTSDPARKYEPHLTWDDLSEIWRGDLLIFDKKKAHLARQKQTPLAYTDTPVYDFGKVLGGSEIKHTFKIKNIGKKPLKIISLKETCACTASVLSQNKILPGKTGEISAVLTVPHGNKHVRESLHVFTDDPVQNTLTLTLTGDAFTPLSTFPTRITFEKQRSIQKPLTKQVSLHIEEGVQIRSVRTDSEHLTATLKTKDGIPHIEVQLLQTIPAGQFSYYLLVDYIYKEKQYIHKVFAFGQVLGELKIAPNRLFLGLIKDPASVSKTITISSPDTKPFKITSVESNTKNVNVTVNTGDSKTNYQVTMTLAQKAEPGELKGDIIINTSSSVQPAVHVPFFGIISDTK